MRRQRRAAAVVGSVAVMLALTLAGVSVASAAAQPPGSRLLTFLWNYQDWLLRPYVAGVTLSGGHTVTVNGKQRLARATANVHVSLRDQPKLAGAARHICRIAAYAVQTLHLRATIAAVRVWSVEEHLVARC